MFRNMSALLAMLTESDVLINKEMHEEKLTRLLTLCRLDNKRQVYVPVQLTTIKLRA